MSDKDIAALLELAKTNLERAKTMTKKEAILSLNKAGILTKKGKFTRAYAELEELVNR
jgi:hypothetical protein